MKNFGNKDESLPRLPAEWECRSGVLMAWPHANSDWDSMLDEAEECFTRIIKALSRHAKVMVIAPCAEEAKRRYELRGGRNIENIKFFDIPTNDTWTRDYGVITTIGPNGVLTGNDFGFNGWGGKFESGLDNRVTSLMFKEDLLCGNYNDLCDFILEGGSIESDGRGTIMTTSSCLLTSTRNKGLSRNDIESVLTRRLGARKVLWLEYGDIIGDDTDGHIDTIARFAPDNTIVYCGMSQDSDEEQSLALKGVKENLESFSDVCGNSFKFVELPMPDAVYDPEDGHRLPATYANFLVVNGVVFLPVYNQKENDLKAESVMRQVFPGYEIESVDCCALIRQHGSLHCSTMQIPLGLMNPNILM